MMRDIGTIKAALQLARRFSETQQDKDEFQRLADMSRCVAHSPSGQLQQAVARIDEIGAALARALTIVPTGKKLIREAIEAAGRITVA